MIICEVFEFDRNTISSTWNKRDPNKPYLYRASTKAEAIRNESSLDIARGGDGTIKGGIWIGFDEPAPVRRRKKKRRRRHDHQEERTAPRDVDHPTPHWWCGCDYCAEQRLEGERLYGEYLLRHPPKRHRKKRRRR